MSQRASRTTLQRTMDWPGRRCRTRPPQLISIDVGRRSRLADAASSPRQAAGATPATTTTTTAAATSAATASAAASAATASAAAAAAGFLDAVFGSRRALFVEDIERRQADVGDFFFTQRDLMARRIRRLRLIVYRCNRCRRASHHCKSQTGRAQCRQGVFHSLLLRSLFNSWHIRILHCLASGSSSVSLLQGPTTRKPRTVLRLPKAGRWPRFHIHERPQ